MAFADHDRYGSLCSPFARSLSRFVEAIAAARQRRADDRLAQYLCGLPDDALRKLGVSPADMEKLRRSLREHPPGLYGRVSVMSVLRNARY